MNNRAAFEAAVRAIKLGQYEAAKAFVQFNPPSDQRIIEKRIEQAMANDANGRENKNCHQ